MTVRMLPGFRLSLGYTMVWLGVIVLLPMAGLLSRAATIDLNHAATLLADPRTLAAFRVSFVSALSAAAVSVPIGLVLAWVLERYRFPLRLVMDAAIDLPFALPTAVAGIALTTLYVPDGWFGQLFALADVTVAYTPLGIDVALLFVSLPFVVRTVQPVMAGLDRAAEEAALVLGATPLQIFRRVILPPLIPALSTGMALAFARAVGEYGSVIFIAGNRPMVSEIAPLLIVTRLEQFDYPGAALLGTAMLAVSLVMLFVIQCLSRETPQHAA